MTPLNKQELEQAIWCMEKMSPVYDDHYYSRPYWKAALEKLKTEFSKQTI